MNTSSGNGGVVPFGDTAVYATTKAAVVTITESLYAHLLRADSPVRASVLFPGPNWLRTNLWDAWRWRPDEYAKTVPRQTPYPSLDQLEQIMEDARRRARVDAARGGRRRRRARHPRRAVLDAAAERHDRRVDPGARRRRCSSARIPTYFRDWKPPRRGRRSDTRSLHGHLGRRPRGRVGSDVPRVPRVRAGTTTSTRGRRRTEPVRGSRGLERLPQLGFRRSGSPSSRRDGIVAEVLFPNTIPPFFPSGALVTPAPNAAGVRAPVGRAAGAQPLARRLLRGRARPPRRASRRSC